VANGVGFLPSQFEAWVQAPVKRPTSRKKLPLKIVCLHWLTQMTIVEVKQWALGKVCGLFRGCKGELCCWWCGTTGSPKGNKWWVYDLHPQNREDQGLTLALAAVRELQLPKICLGTTAQVTF
jgi:hypothetical protein